MCFEVSLEKSLKKVCFAGRLTELTTGALGLTSEGASHLINENVWVF